jgi:ERCC4-related helicase
MVDLLLPVEGCCVRRRTNQERLGYIRGRREVSGRWQLKVGWGNGAEEWVDLSELTSGFQLGWLVQDVPLSTTRRPLGAGRVVGRRSLGDHEQVLAQLENDGRSIWLPYQNLRRIKDVRMRYVRAETGSYDDHAERFRLRLLAHALENWNQLTGSLDRLDVDPLPHQIQLVHRILTSGNYNWLIADDVGLGKTIEVGLLLGALKRKGHARRVLIVAPAGLTRQWQDELRYKFDEIYEIYGRDFEINIMEHWKLHDHVIVSLDLAKRDEHLAKFRNGADWDVVVFDEGHKLTRYASGERAQRYRLAEALRPRTDAFLLLSGTPHQGYTDRFIALLELVRPDLKNQIHTLETNPEVVGELILRNRKSEVTDVDGNFIFKGTQVHRIPIEPSAEALSLQRLLHDYLRRGYKAGENAGSAARAIGFVMTTYRKLASSSVAAIERALRLRLERLAGVAALSHAPVAEQIIEDLSEGGDDQDDLVNTLSDTKAEEFFAFEKELIEGVLAAAIVARKTDEKLRIFLRDVVDPLIQRGEKLLIFTEFRATQTYLQEALECHFAHAGPVVLINGSMNLDEKLVAIAAFNRAAPFLISTEAGGEGINLHRACHVMVNYDLPWNPARLVQRIGRLYRYGQHETVVVFNLHARDTFDNNAIDLMLQRVTQIVQDMAPVGSEYNARLYSEILGEVLDNLDLAVVLQSATSMELERTREQIEAAVARAREAQQLQQELFSHVSGFDRDALRGTLGFTMQHVGGFIESMLPMIGVTFVASHHGGRVLEIRLPEDLRGIFPEFAQRTAVSVTTDRRLAQRLSDVVILDFEVPFFRYLIERAKSHEFDGYYASASGPPGINGVIAAFKLRWQNDQGEVLTEEFVPLFASDAEISSNPPFLADWILARVPSAPIPNTERGERNQTFEALLKAAHKHLEAESTRFKHPNSLVQIGAADCR